MHLAVRMDFGISHSLATLHKEDFHFVLLPSEHGEMDGTDGGEEFFAGGAIVHTNQTHNPIREQNGRFFKNKAYE